MMQSSPNIDLLIKLVYFSKCSALGILLFLDPSVESLVLTTCAFVKLNPSNSSNLFVEDHLL